MPLLIFAFNCFHKLKEFHYKFTEFTPLSKIFKPASAFKFAACLMLLAEP